MTAATIHELFDRHRDSDAVAIDVPGAGESVTYRELVARIGRTASALRAAGLRKGDALAIWVPNGIDWVALFAAAARLGVLAVPLNTRYKSPEVAHLLSVSRATTLVVQPGFHGIDFVGMAAEALRDEGCPVRTVLLAGRAGHDEARESFEALGVQVHAVSELTASAPVHDGLDGGEDDPVVVFGTSGTTSFPKLAVHRQAAAHRHVGNVAEAMELDGEDRVLCILPFCGTYGFIALMSCLSAGARAVVLPVYEEGAVAEAMDANGITCLFAVEAVVRSLLADEAAGARTGRFRSWTKGGIAGVKVRDMVDLADEVFGCRLVNLYGSSELFAMMATWRLGDPAERRAIAGGRVLEPRMHARSVDPVTREPLPVGESGELEFSGFHVTDGYLANEEADGRAFTADGWYVSGDRGRLLDDGRVLEYQSRLTDTLRLRGFLVSPAEIEELLAGHPLVHAVQVVGVPGADGNDRAVAFYLREADGPEGDKPETGGPEDDLRAFCRERAAAWKVPDLFVPVERFPTTPSANGDKVQKGRLRETASELLAARLTEGRREVEE